MKRREFLGLVGGAAAFPDMAVAQLKPTPVVGYLHSASPGPYAHLSAAFRRGLEEAGYVEGRNVAIEYRWAEGQFSRLPALAAELVERKVSVIAAFGGSAPPLAAQKATSLIPVVFSSGEVDPVKSGLVGSLNRPGGNVTGISPLTGVISAKRMELLRELAPQASSVAYLANRNNPNFGSTSKDVLAAAQALRFHVQTLYAGTEREIDVAFDEIARQGTSVLFVGADPFYFAQRNQIVRRTAHQALPACYYSREFVAAGGLISYAASFADAYRQAGVYTGRILKGEKPADLPVVQSVKFDLVINLKTAKGLGLTVPPTLLARADEVIE